MKTDEQKIAELEARVEELEKTSKIMIDVGKIQNSRLKSIEDAILILANYCAGDKEGVLQ